MTILYQRLNADNFPRAELHLNWRRILFGFSLPHYERECQCWLWALHFGPLHFVYARPTSENR